MTGPLDGVTKRLVYQDRMDSARKVVSDVKNSGVWTAITGGFERFGENNRGLLHGLIGRKG